MANVNVTYQEMTAAGDRLNTGRQEIDDMLSQLKRLVEDLVSGGYVTDASSKAFQSSYEQFNTGATQTIAGLDGMAQYLKQAAATFESADTELANAIR